MPAAATGYSAPRQSSRGGGDVVGGARFHRRGHVGNPVESAITWILPPKCLFLPEYPDMVAGLDTLGYPIGRDQGAVQCQVQQLIAFGLGEGLMEVRGLRGQHVEALVQIPARGGPGQPVIASQVLHAHGVTKPAQHEFRLRPGNSGPLLRPPIVGLAVAVQQTGEVGKGFDRHVVDGRVGKHVGSLQRI